MILLGADALSEPLKRAPDPMVLNWLDAQAVETLAISALVLAELLSGLNLRQNRKRQQEIQRRLSQDVLPLFEGRIISFDEASVPSYLGLMGRTRADGKAISKAENYIAAIAIRHGLTVATRDIEPFAAAGLSVIDPWSASV